MVARPPVRFVIDRMTHADLAAVQQIEKVSFSTPWPSYAYRNELETNRLAHYLVVRAGREVIGYAGIWLMVDEAHVTTFAVAPAPVGPSSITMTSGISRRTGSSSTPWPPRRSTPTSSA